MTSATGWVYADPRVLSLDEVIRKALDNSYELKIARVDVQISKTDVLTARSDYFPNIQARLNTEYLKDLDNTFRPVTSVGNTIIPSGTRFQNSMGLTLNQKITDFGARGQKVRMAKSEVRAKQAVYDQMLRDLKIKMIELYEDALTNYRSIKANEAILALAQQGYQMKKRLNAAGNTSAVDVVTEAIQVAQGLDELETLRHKYEESLHNLSFYTHEAYNPAETELADLETGALETLAPFSAINSPEALRFDAQIEQKEHEIAYLKRQKLPQINFYSYYNFYGFDPDNWGDSVRNFSHRTVQFGLTMSAPIFDGFKNKAAVDKAKLEKEKLMLQKTRVLAELAHRAEGFQQKVHTQTVLLGTKAVILNKTQDKLTMDNRLSEQQVIDRTQTIQDHIARIHRQLDTEKALIQQISAAKKLKVLEGGI
ncbi:MAG TPA: TolC family protein [Oculatellaceae cyanobacterium]